MTTYEALKDGPTVEPWDTWRYRQREWRVEKLVWQDDVLYVYLESWSAYDPAQSLVPVATLLREGRKDGYPYPETLRCRECGVEATGVEFQLENAGWWVYGMGSGPLCPTHNSNAR